MTSNKTLLEILIDELPKRRGWPEGVFSISQFKSGELCYHKEGNVCSNASTSVYLQKHSEGDATDWAYGIYITRDQYESALTEKNEGWIQWDGGRCPVETGTLVDIKVRDGRVITRQPALRHTKNGATAIPNAGFAFWCNDGAGDDIIAYRLSKPEDEKQVEYDYGHISSDCEDEHVPTIESLTDAIIEYGCEANLAYPLAKHLLSKGLFK